MQCMSHRNEWGLSKSSILNFSTKESQFTSFTSHPRPRPLQVFLLWLPALMTWILDSFNLLSSFHHRLYVDFTATLAFLLMMILLLPWFAPYLLFSWLLWLLLPISTVTIGHTFHFSTQRHCFTSSFPFTEHSFNIPAYTQSEVGIPMLRSSASDTCFI